MSVTAAFGLSCLHLAGLASQAQQYLQRPPVMSAEFSMPMHATPTEGENLRQAPLCTLNFCAAHAVMRLALCKLS